LIEAELIKEGTFSPKLKIWVCIYDWDSYREDVLKNVTLNNLDTSKLMYMLGFNKETALEHVPTGTKYWLFEIELPFGKQEEKLDDKSNVK